MKEQRGLVAEESNRQGEDTLSRSLLLFEFVLVDCLCVSQL
jgi:hypothetical protein